MNTPEHTAITKALRVRAASLRRLADAIEADAHRLDRIRTEEVPQYGPGR